MKNLTTQTWIRIALGAIALALIIFKNIDATVALGLAAAVYEFIINKKETVIKAQEGEISRFRESEKNFSK